MFRNDFVHVTVGGMSVFLHVFERALGVLLRRPHFWWLGHCILSDSTYHDIDNIDTTLSDCRHNSLHHGTIPEMDMEITRSWKLQFVSLFQLHLARS